MESNKGMTLIETILATGLIAVLIMIGYMFYFTGVKAFDRNADRAEMQHNVRYSISYISEALLGAGNLEVIVEPNKLIIDQTAFNLSEGALKINRNYFSSGSRFTVLAENIATFEVTRSGKMISIMIISKPKNSDEPFMLETQVLLRRP